MCTGVIVHDLLSNILAALKIHELLTNYCDFIIQITTSEFLKDQLYKDSSLSVYYIYCIVLSLILVERGFRSIFNSYRHLYERYVVYFIKSTNNAYFSSAVVLNSVEDQVSHSDILKCYCMFSVQSCTACCTEPQYWRYCLITVVADRNHCSQSVNDVQLKANNVDQRCYDFHFVPWWWNCLSIYCGIFANGIYKTQKTILLQINHWVFPFLRFWIIACTAF